MRCRRIERQLKAAGKLEVVLVLLLLAVSLPAGAAEMAVDGEDTDAQCAECHEAAATDHTASVHGALGCLECHPGAAAEDHEAAPALGCRECHPPHDEKVIHDVHSRVDCKACHTAGGVPGVEPESGRVVWSGEFRPGPTPGPHQAIRTGEDDACKTCHFRGNAVGAASLVLPPKSVLCAPCHAATVSAGDGVTLAALAVFLIGAAGMGGVWAAAAGAGEAGRPPARIGAMIRAMRSWGAAEFPQGAFSRLRRVLWNDVLLIRRLFRLSRSRWVIHALIVYPMAFRFAFGLSALFLSLLLPDLPLTGAMLDKNNPVVAFTFDLTGAMMLAGAAGAILRDRRAAVEGLAELPEPGRGMPLMIALMVLVGFLLEGIRIAMTGTPEGAEWAFLGVAASQLFRGMTGLTNIYGYAWYLHAILVGIFVALIPFTHMSHIFAAPLSLMMDARGQTRGHSSG